ncbi:MAG: metal ABC transporter permease [Gammaproteobacteria bacterium]
MSIGEWLFAPFIEFSFMRRALVGCLAMALGCAPIGVFLVLRRMSLMGDAMGHAILPGAAIGFLIAGLSLPAMTLGGLIAGLAVALGAGAVARATAQREDASFAAFYLTSLALGVTIVSTKGSNVDLLHVLFGTVLALDNAALLLLAAIASITLVALAAIYRALVVECFDPSFLKTLGGTGLFGDKGSFVHLLFLALAVLNLVGGFQALGTLMVVGIMMLPAVAARFWAREVWSMIAVAIVIAVLASMAGLLMSYHANLPTGPAIILMAGVLYGVSVLFGFHDSVFMRLIKLPHLNTHPSREGSRS